VLQRVGIDRRHRDRRAPFVVDLVDPGVEVAVVGQPVGIIEPHLLHQQESRQMGKDLPHSREGPADGAPCPHKGVVVEAHDEGVDQEGVDGDPLEGAEEVGDGQGHVLVGLELVAEEEGGLPCYVQQLEEEGGAPEGEGGDQKGPHCEHGEFAVLLKEGEPLLV